MFLDSHDGTGSPASTSSRHLRSVTHSRRYLNLPTLSLFYPNYLQPSSVLTGGICRAIHLTAEVEREVAVCC